MSRAIKRSFLHTQGSTSDFFFLQDVIEQKENSLFIAALNNWDVQSRQEQGLRRRCSASDLLRGPQVDFSRFLLLYPRHTAIAGSELGNGPDARAPKQEAPRWPQCCYHLRRVVRQKARVQGASSSKRHLEPILERFMYFILYFVPVWKSSGGWQKNRFPDINRRSGSRKELRMGCDRIILSFVKSKLV